MGVESEVVARELCMVETGKPTLWYRRGFSGWGECLGLMSVWIAAMALLAPGLLWLVTETLRRAGPEANAISIPPISDWMVRAAFMPVAVLPVAGLLLGAWALWLRCSRVRLVAAGMAVDVGVLAAAIIALMPLLPMGTPG